MKATGIVRRIDDLGRVVIPKEIRRTMRIREGDPSHWKKNLRLQYIVFWNDIITKRGEIHLAFVVICIFENGML